jgi:hypothetical protein
MTIHFNKLHKRSERVEGVILLLGISAVAVVGWAESTRA